MTKASIIIPVYNGEKTLRAAIDSALDQSAKAAFEIIIVNDGSTDGTADIIASYDDPRLRVVNQLNGGLNAARNSGIRAAKGEYIGLLDADDIWHPAKLAAHIRHLDANPEIGLSFSASRLIDGMGEPTGLMQKPKLKDISARDLICFNPVGNGSAPVLRRAALEGVAHPHPTEGRICWFDEELRQSTDIECWMRIALLTEWKIEGLPEALTLYRVNPEGLSANVIRQYETWLQMLGKTAAFAPEFVAEHGEEARAWQLRYLTRRAVSLRQGGLAWSLAWQALQASPAILRQQPVKTITTLAAASVLRWCGERFYVGCESLLLGARRSHAAT